MKTISLSLSAGGGHSAILSRLGYGPVAGSAAI